MFDLALDLLNTRGPIQGSDEDGLATPRQLLTWLAERGLPEERSAALRASPPAAAVLLVEARRLRDHTAQALHAVRAGRPVPPEAIQGIDRALAACSVSKRLQVDERGPVLSDQQHARTPLALLSGIALAAAHLVTSVSPRRIRQCASASCAAWFVDESKAGRRKWCSMTTCGNRAKAAKHRRKRRQRGAAAESSS